MNEVGGSQLKQGAVLGGWICIAIGMALMIWTLVSFFMYLPLFLAAFVLGIVAIAQRHLLNGIPILLLSVVVPLVFGLGLGAYRVKQVFEHTPALTSTLVPTQPVTPEPTTASTTASTLSSAAASTATPTLASPPPNAKEPRGPSPEQLYIESNLQIYEFKAEYVDTTLDGRIPGITFKLRNKGDRMLDKVKVVVLFKDATGAVISEEDYFPVSVTEYSFTGDNKPLKPGYIWQMERGKIYQAKSVPSEWKEGSAEAKVTEIRFAELPAND